MASRAIFLSLTRQLIFLIPMLLILPNFLGIVGVWVSMPAADAAAVIVAFVMLMRYKKKHVDPLIAAENNNEVKQ